MPLPPPQPRGHLPRLAPEFYRGTAVVFWTHTIHDRGTGWLNPAFHAFFREILLHAAVRERLLCPLYTLRPDHLHLIWMGVGPASDQRAASTFLRGALRPRLSPHRFQHQPHDHVLREQERKRDALAKICDYIADNPGRAGLAETSNTWAYTGCMVPGYFDLTPHAGDYWEKFWRIYTAAVERGALGKMGKG